MTGILTIATLNTWGVFYARDRVRRLQAVAVAAAGGAFDIIGLQEVWQDADRRRIETAVQAAGYYTHYYASGMIGSGLMTLSRYPILTVDFMRFRPSGSPETMYHGDYIASKGIGLARIGTPGGIVDFYNTHLVAQYVDDATDHYPAHRAAQMVEAARFIRAYSQATPAVLAGDLNTRPYQIGYNVAHLLGELRDVYALLHPNSDGWTIDPANIYTHDGEPQRIDYIMVSDSDSHRLEAQRIRVDFQQVPGAQIPYSDHYGLVAELTLVPAEAPRKQPGREARLAVLNAVLDVLDGGITRIEQRRQSHAHRSRFGGWLALASLMLHKGLRRLTLPLLLGWTGITGLLAHFLIRAELRDLRAIRAEVQAERDAVARQDTPTHMR
ncbi:MAG: endonuclease/exonuclease/phosphatase family protein [Chloroflexota bacterium]